MSLTLDQVSNMMRVNKHRLDDELEIHPDIAHKISEALATANAKAGGLKEELTQLESNLLISIRRGGEKLTAGEVTAEIETDPKRVSKMREYLSAKKDAERWTGAHDAWKQRGYALKGLGDLYVAQYFTVDSAGKDGGYAGDRKRLAEARKEVVQEPVVRRRKIMED